MSPTKALFWKEWRQMQWRWVFCQVITLLFVYVGMRTRILEDEAIIMFCFLGCAFPFPLFIAMGLFAEEREEGSLRMQLSLPVYAGRIYIIKMVLGATAIISLITAALLLVIIMAGNREKSTAEILRTFDFVMPFGIIYMLWTVVFSIKRRTQWAAALTGIAIAACWIFLVFLDDMFISHVWRDYSSLSLVITPLGFLEAGPDKGKWLATTVVQTILAIVLFGWGMKRFSTLSRSSK